MDLDRRGFLQSASAAVFLRGADKPINVAFIGRGNAVRKNIKYAAETQGIHVAAPGDFYKMLSDPSIHAVYIGEHGGRQAAMAVAACEAGKDIWVESPAFTNLNDGRLILEAARRRGRIVQTGAAYRSAAHIRKARDIVRRGELGHITFCRAGGTAAVIDMLQFVFDEAVPRSVSAQSGLATYRYLTFVASHESRGNSEVTIHGTLATLTLTLSSYRCASPLSLRLGADRPNGDSMHLAHWANFVACIRSRQKPAADIETAVRSATTCLMADLVFPREAA